LCAGVGIEPEPPVLLHIHWSTAPPHIIQAFLLEKALPVPERIQTPDLWV